MVDGAVAVVALDGTKDGTVVVIAGCLDVAVDGGAIGLGAVVADVGVDGMWANGLGTIDLAACAVGTTMGWSGSVVADDALVI